MTTALAPEIAQSVQAWLDGQYDEATKAEVRRLLDAQEYTALTDAFYKELEFGTGGLRGLMGVGCNRMNRYTVGQATQGLANYLLQSFPGEALKVAIAYDSRNQSPEFARLTAEVFSANGITVYLFTELRPTPELSFAIRVLGCQSGVVITASHNPKEYNGYKAYWVDGGQVVPPHDQNIIAEVQKVRLEDIRFEGRPELILPLGAEMDEKYLEQVLTLTVAPEAVQRQKDMKIVFTSIHGTSITLVPTLLARMGFENVHVVQEQATPDGNFPTVVYPNPEEAEALSIGLAQAQAMDADLLLGTDPDADRVGIALKNHQGQWQLLNGNQTATLLIHHLIEARKQAGKMQGHEYIAKTIVTTDLLDAIAQAQGLEVFNTLTGFKYIAEVIRENEGRKYFLGGGEESYGYLAGEFVRDKDAIMACGLIAEMVAYAKDQGKSPFEQLIDIYTQYGFYYEELASLTKKGKAGAEEIQAMMHNFRQNPPKSLGGQAVVQVADYQSREMKDLRTGEVQALPLDKSNVLQFFTEEGSKISARPSGTEPKIKFYFSVRAALPQREAFEEVQAALKAKIAALRQDLGIDQ
ncbi:MAG: phospho-sugar mutase [Microscillaceae bacterium]|nr:phospho-sugar mutase [Microscillaceae bacterium]